MTCRTSQPRLPIYRLRSCPKRHPVDCTLIKRPSTSSPAPLPSTDCTGGFRPSSALFRGQRSHIFSELYLSYKYFTWEIPGFRKRREIIDPRHVSLEDGETCDGCIKMNRLRRRSFLPRDAFAKRCSLCHRNSVLLFVSLVKL